MKIAEHFHVSLHELDEFTDKHILAAARKTDARGKHPAEKTPF